MKNQISQKSSECDVKIDQQKSGGYTKSSASVSSGFNIQLSEMYENILRF